MMLISVVTACYNEEDNITEIYSQVKAVFSECKVYRYEHLFIDNASTDGTVKVLKQIAQADSNVKVILNARNFGHIRSSYYALLQANGDAVISIAADLQEPPQLILKLIQQWEAGFKIVAGVRKGTAETFPMSVVRRVYYYLINKIAEIKLVNNFTGFGLYDQQVIKILRNFKDSYPYFRGLISEIGFPISEVYFFQPLRKHGKTKNNFYTFYDLAVLGVTAHSKFPIRLATIVGFFLSIFSFAIAIVFFLLKIFLWYRFPVGIAPIIIAVFFFSSVQLFFIGILGEYVLSIHVQSLMRPLVIESERINF